jgi:hypothetical protein
MTRVDSSRSFIVKRARITYHNNFRATHDEQWNIMLAWNHVLTSSMSIFQTSCEHVLVVRTGSTFCACHVLSLDRSDRLASSRIRIKNYRYRHRHYILIHQQLLCVV